MFTELGSFFLRLVDTYGILGVATGMFLEGLGVPFAGMVILIGSGTLITSGRASYLTLVLAATVGATIGSSLSYGIGYYFGNVLRRRHHGRFLKHEDMLKNYADKYGEFGIFVAQLFGTARTFISLPAGVVRMNFKKFVIGTFFGSMVFVAFMAYLSSYIQRFIHRILNYFGIPLWFGVFLIFLSGMLMLAYYMRDRVTDEDIKD